MKNVLIVGEGSYIGTSFARYASSRYNIKTICMKDGKLTDADFSSIDSVLHCAGIAHVAQKKNMRQLYYEINCDLAVNVAEKAKAAGVEQFVFLSSMSVYGDINGVITPETEPKATDFYGGSKLAAEEKLRQLASSVFSICILRPPMVYGFGCKGNFPRLVALAKRLPVFPNVQNRRSMIYIDNLCEFICQAIDNNKSGIHLPQNAEYMNTTELVKIIAQLHGKRMRTTRVFNPLISFLKKFFSPVDKLFSDLVYVKTGNEAEYNVVSFEDGARVAVLGK